MKKGLLFPLLIVLFNCLISCQVVKEYTTVMVANNAYQEGSYQKANYLYLELTKSERYSDYIAYNLGNVYHDLGVMDSALEQWEKVETSDDSNLRFKMYFNKGVLYYGRGEYKKAFEQFRTAILTGANGVRSKDLLSAKKNLEICLQKLNVEIVGDGKITRTQRKKEKSDYATEQMMNFVKNRERINWSMYIDKNQGSEEDY